MFSLLVLGIALLLFWAWGVWDRSGMAGFMQPWRHVPLIAAIIVLLMAAGSALR